MKLYRLGQARHIKNIKRLISLGLALCLIASLLAACAMGGGVGNLESRFEEMTNGEFVPADFRFYGGSGRVEISCKKVTVEDGRATARLVFDSPNYEYVKVGEDEYDRLEESGDNESQFEIPVQLDKRITISALTTAMSAPHEIEYQIYVGTGTVEADDQDGEETLGSALGAKRSFTPPDALPGLTLKSEMHTDYAQGFKVYYYEGGYKLINVEGSAQYLLIPEGGRVPENLPEGIVKLQAPIDQIYLAATSAMSLFFAMGGEDKLLFTGTDASGWQIKGPARAIETGAIKYAGKYSAPDYELMVGSACDVAIESTMILHAPDVKEKLEDLGIPVFIDTSSYESHPLGRTEWIRLYGAMVDMETQADKFFEKQKGILDEVESLAKEERIEPVPTVAFFSVTTQGRVSVRRADDYIPKMISLAGGRYILDSLVSEDKKGGTETISMEEFVSRASDVDYLIYNATIENSLKDLDSLKSLDPIFEDFKAVKEAAAGGAGEGSDSGGAGGISENPGGVPRVWQVGKSMYQSTDTAAEFTQDIYNMLHGGDESKMRFLTALK